MPITLKGMRLILIDLPMGSSVPNKVLTVALPSTATRAEVVISVSLMNRPEATCQLRTVSYVGVMPETWVLELLPPNERPDCGVCATRKSVESLMLSESVTPGVSNAKSR